MFCLFVEFAGERIRRRQECCMDLERVQKYRFSISTHHFVGDKERTNAWVARTMHKWNAARETEVVVLCTKNKTENATV